MPSGASAASAYTTVPGCAASATTDREHLNEARCCRD